MTDPKRLFDALGLDSQVRASLDCALQTKPLSTAIKARSKLQLFDAMALPSMGVAGVKSTSSLLTLKGVFVSIVATTALLGSTFVLTRERSTGVSPAPAIESVRALASRKVTPPTTPSIEPKTTATIASSGAHSPPTIRATTPPEQTILAAEAALLEQARTALSQNPTRSLALVAQFDKRFVRPQLRAERNEIEILALTALGRHEQAKSKTQAATLPDSIYRTKAQITNLKNP